MNNKKTYILLGIILFVIIGSIFVIKESGIFIDNNINADSDNSVTDSLEDDNIADSETKEDNAESDKKESEASKEENNNAVGESEKADKQEANIDTFFEAIDDSEEMVTNEEIVFPYEIPGTGLIVERIEPYSGEYFEDGSNSNVEDIAAMLLTNKSSSNIEYAEISIMSGDEQLNFSASAIPEGMTVVIQEQNKKGIQSNTYKKCKATVAEKETFEKNEDIIKIEETEAGSLKVTNLTSSDISCVRVFYKYYMQDANVYVGGITYNAKITDLKANEEREVAPKHYIKDYSKILMVRVYETSM